MKVAKKEKKSLKCPIIGHSQKMFMILNFNHGIDNSHFLRILITFLWL